MTKKRLNDKLGEFFEIENDMVEVESSPKQELINPEKIETRTEDITDDYEFRRQTLYGLVDNGQEALQHLIMVAK